MHSLQTLPTTIEQTHPSVAVSCATTTQSAKPQHDVHIVDCHKLSEHGQ